MMIGGLSSVLDDLGGHSRFSFTSSFAESPVVCDMTLELRDPVPDVDGRLVCSKRPMRLATLWRGRSSGSGLIMIPDGCR